MRKMKLGDFLYRHLSYRERGLRKVLVWQFLILNPFMTLLFTLLYGGTENLLHHFAISYLITAIVSAVINLTLYGARYLDAAVRKVLAKPVRVPPRLWWFTIALCAMPPGLYVASRTLELLGPFVGGDFGAFSVADFKTGIVFGTLTGAAFFAISIFVDTKKSLELSELKLRESENQHLRAQLSALTAQMNPHVLFNALNTVAALVATDPARAEETIVTLSELYRGVLSASQNMTHSLQTELDLCDAYLRIEKARFGDRIQSVISVANDVDPLSLLIPSLCLQPLVENAVKHGLSKRASGGRVSVHAQRTRDRIRLVIEDDGVGFDPSVHVSSFGTGTGLANSRERIALHYANQATFKVGPRPGGGTVVVIELPFQLAVSPMEGMP